MYIRKLKPPRPSIEAFCHRMVGHYVMYRSFDIDVESIQIDNETVGYLYGEMLGPTDSFSKDSFNENAGQMKEINKIILFEKMRECAITLFAGPCIENMYRKRKFPLRNYYNKNPLMFGDGLNPYTILKEEVEKANKIIGYKHFNEIHLLNWEEEVYMILETNHLIWFAIILISKYVIRRYKYEVGRLEIANDQLEGRVCEFFEPGSLCYLYPEEIYEQA